MTNHPAVSIIILVSNGAARTQKVRAAPFVLSGIAKVLQYLQRRRGVQIEFFQTRFKKKAAQPQSENYLLKEAEEDAVAGYGLGADDYVRKPFGAAELRAKVAAHLRRERRPRSHALSFGEVRIDLGARGLAVGGEAVPLTPTEYAICEYLARHPGQVMSRAQIREAVLGWESDADDAAISMQVSRARRKLSEAGADPIATVWGMGYKWQL